ncbi:hypothetical protein GWK47_016581 [Chionoecetes opilio]|uniref:Uncharacterized protein n=1 Tax=Chionoecetes opilio TaxID=41210 RepID=A0A8J5CHP7_CHIOP|nr:hypothetical protein GWK47_016581 [Chionoecetes opilio]
MPARRVLPRYALTLLLLAVAGGGWCQTQLLDPEPRPCRTQDAAAAAALSQGRRNEYPAGGVLMVLAKVAAGLFGSLEVYLCPEGDAQVECRDRVPLQLADGSGTRYSLHDVPRTDNYEIAVLLPDDITCPTCTLQVTQGQLGTDSREGSSFMTHLTPVSPQLRVLTRACARHHACPTREHAFCADIAVRELPDG